MVQTAEVAVIDAGVIDLAIAQRMAAEGREVVLIDPARRRQAQAMAMQAPSRIMRCIPWAPPMFCAPCPRCYLTAIRRCLVGGRACRVWRRG